MKRLTFLLIFVVALFSVADAQNDRRSDEDLIAGLSSSNEEAAKNAVKKIFKRSDKMIPLLLKLEGNGTCFRAISELGSWSGGTVRFNSPKCDTYDKVTTEIAALFLISAIFNEDIEFAPPPLLCEYSKENKMTGECRNTDTRIKKAWESTRNWYRSVEEKGIVWVREHGNDPLENSGLIFW